MDDDTLQAQTVGVETETKISTIIEFDDTKKTIADEITRFKSSDEFTPDNFERESDRVYSRITSIDQQINRIMGEIKNRKAVLRKLYENDKTKRLAESEMVPQDLMKEEKILRFHFEDIFAMNWLAMRYIRILVTKLLRLLTKLNSYDFDVKIVEARQSLYKDYQAVGKDQLDAFKEITKDLITSRVSELSRRLEVLERKSMGMTTITETIEKEVKVPVQAPDTKTLEDESSEDPQDKEDSEDIDGGVDKAKWS